MKSVGFDNVYCAYTKEDVARGIADMGSSRSAMVVYVTQGSREDLGRPTVSPEQNKINMMKEFSCE